MPQPLQTIRKARQLRRKMTLPEVLLWQRLRRSPLGLKFRRQHPIGPYVLDFYCPCAKTGIEIDGVAHDMGHNPERDLARDEWLQDQGVSLIRLPAAQVLKNAPETAETIARDCAR